MQVPTDPITQPWGGEDETGRVHSNTAPPRGNLRGRRINVPPPLACGLQSRLGPPSQIQRKEDEAVKLDSSRKQSEVGRPVVHAHAHRRVRSTNRVILPSKGNHDESQGRASYRGTAEGVVMDVKNLQPSGGLLCKHVC